ncbi:hypothetical protein GU926_07405 [Nibribacter ruber]|uniref:Uncharacterized protein n=1 Tax=Nibribacter ruber TaxID=2698458 RepID=A0A6P1NTS2_9BACT|nr:hypothetical protein [Nibribacter ruber]QHL87266.1 hypothetical protein GU926_07405 [Nibribacter ruber]
MRDHIKTKPDLGVPLLIICVGFLFLAVIILPSKFELTNAGYIICGFISFFIFSGLWKIGHFELKDHLLTKYQLLGLVKRTVDLKYLVKYRTKTYNLTRVQSITSLIPSKSDKYRNPREATLHFTNSSKMVLDEELIPTKDFDLLLEKISLFSTESTLLA